MISEQDFDRLSAYLDHQLSATEKSALEARLLNDPELKAALRDLRLQARALRDLPQVKVRRNFTLIAKQAEAIRPARRSWFATLFPVLRTATALSAFAFVAVLATNFLQQPIALQTASAPQVAAPQVAMEKEAIPADSSAAGAAAASTEDIAALQRNTLEATATVESMVGITGVESFSETQVAEHALTPSVASPDLAPEAANAPPTADAVAQQPAVTGLQLAAIGLGLVTAILVIFTWLARR